MNQLRLQYGLCLLLLAALLAGCAPKELSAYDKKAVGINPVGTLDAAQCRKLADRLVELNKVENLAEGFTTTRLVIGGVYWFFYEARGIEKKWRQHFAVRVDPNVSIAKLYKKSKRKTLNYGNNFDGDAAVELTLVMARQRKMNTQDYALRPVKANDRVYWVAMEPRNGPTKKRKSAATRVAKTGEVWLYR